MYQCRNINRNARCIMSTCNTQLQLILLNSFVFLTSFVFLSGKGHFLMTDDRRKDPKFKFTPRKSSLISCSQTPRPFCTFHSAEASGQTQAWTGRQRDLCGSSVKVLKFYSSSTNVKLVLEQELKPQEMAEWQAHSHSASVQVRAHWSTTCKIPSWLSLVLF